MGSNIPVKATIAHLGHLMNSDPIVETTVLAIMVAAVATQDNFNGGSGAGPGQVTSTLSTMLVSQWPCEETLCRV